MMTSFDFTSIGDQRLLYRRYIVLIASLQGIFFRRGTPI